MSELTMLYTVLSFAGGTIAFFLVRFFNDVDKIKTKMDDTFKEIEKTHSDTKEDFQKELALLKMENEIRKQEMLRHIENVAELKVDMKDIKSKMGEISDYMHKSRHELNNERQSALNLQSILEEINKKLGK